MTDMLFILTILFVAYIVYTMVDDQKATSKSTTLDTKQKVEIVLQPQKLSVEPEITIVDNTPPAALKITQTSKKPSVSSSIASKRQVRNPKTGEIASTSSNYRFTKRWLKETLVAEKLLDKIYKNDELNEETEAKIKDALAKIETMKKYRA